MRELELYVHIPFCVKKCAYCDFLSFPAGEAEREQYVRVLREEIRAGRYLGETYEVSSIFFGGGTPSLLAGEQIAELLGEIRDCFPLRPDAEITAECNPGTLTAGKLAAYRNAGVNRLSMGLQSAHNKELKMLGRIHTWEEFRENFLLARELGFANINVDLMSGLPGQTRESFQETLRAVTALEPEHISAYSLILEEGTPFYELYGGEESGRGEAKSGRDEAEECPDGGRTDERSEEQEHLPALPDEETERQMYYDAKTLLEQAGYRRYEISNYAKPGRECRHNLGYWRRTEYKGFGLGAASLLGSCRLRNTAELNAYLEAPQSAVTESEELAPEDILAETMFLGLRTTEGVRLTPKLRTVYGSVLEKYENQGFLREERGRLRLTEAGVDVSNWILADFLL